MVVLDVVEMEDEDRVGVIIVKSTAVRPRHKDSSRSAERSKLSGSRCFVAAGMLASERSSATVSQRAVCPLEMLPDRWQVIA